MVGYSATPRTAQFVLEDLGCAAVSLVDLWEDDACAVLPAGPTLTLLGDVTWYTRYADFERVRRRLTGWRYPTLAMRLNLHRLDMVAEHTGDTGWRLLWSDPTSCLHPADAREFLTVV